MSIEIMNARTRAVDPLEALEAAAGGLNYEAERIDSHELHLVLPGVWRDVGLWFTWRRELSTLQMGAPLDLKTTPASFGDAARLVVMVNERLWLGHFDLWSEDRAIVYRNAAVLPDGGVLDPLQAECLIRGTAEAIDRFYPAFNYLIWGGKTPEQALKSSLFETSGTA